MSDKSVIINYMKTFDAQTDWDNVFDGINETYKALALKGTIKPFTPDNAGREVIRVLQSSLPSYTNAQITLFLQALYNCSKDGSISQKAYNPKGVVSAQDTISDLDKNVVTRALDNVGSVGTKIVIAVAVLGGLYVASQFLTAKNLSNRAKV
jgi:hypothetical protein